MTAFVILAGGRGTRVGRVGAGLHKALLPLADRAVLSRMFDRGPRDARIVICLGYKGQQIRDYVAAAHPKLDVMFVDDPNWNQPGSGPGTGLLAAREAVGDDDLVFVSCDTLWGESDGDMWNLRTSWVGVAAIPPGTPPARWCRIATTTGDVVTDVHDKTNYDDPNARAYIGLARIAAADLATFWDGIEHGSPRGGERQVSDGFVNMLLARRPLTALTLAWADVGDADAYREVVARMSGYDWVKTDEATFVETESDRVIKYNADRNAIENRASRAADLGRAVPSGVRRHGDFMIYDYVPGLTAYDVMDSIDGDVRLGRPAAMILRLQLLDEILKWRQRMLTRYAAIATDRVAAASRAFYRDKTWIRIDMLRPELRRVAADAVDRVDWDHLVAGTIPGVWHGDLNFGNLIVKDADPDSRYVGIDWRGDFAGRTSWGDLRYDVAKLAAGCVVHWGNARKGNLLPWDYGEILYGQIMGYVEDHPATCGTTQDVAIIAALSLINSAPLHASPLDEVAVARGVAQLVDAIQ